MQILGNITLPLLELEGCREEREVEKEEGFNRKLDSGGMNFASHH